MCVQVYIVEVVEGLGGSQTLLTHQKYCVEVVECQQDHKTWLTIGITEFVHTHPGIKAMWLTHWVVSYYMLIYLSPSQVFGF